MLMWDETLFCVLETDVGVGQVAGPSADQVQDQGVHKCTWCQGHLLQVEGRQLSAFSRTVT